jgi:UDP-glucose 4-epimerase
LSDFRMACDGRTLILLTGSTGLIGQSVKHRLGERYKVVTIGRSESSDIQCDLSGPVTRLAEDLPQPDRIVHLAAAVPSIEQPDDENSAEKTRAMDGTVFELSRLWGCGAVYASGCSLYPPSESPSEENSPLLVSTSSAYLNAKLHGDDMFAAAPNSCVLRISCPIGKPVPERSVLGTFINQVRTNRPINVFGQGTREQDYVDVRDIADAVERVVRVSSTGVFNIASGRPTTMKKLATLLIDICGGGQVHLASADDSQEGRPARYSIAKARSELGWQPRFSLRQSVRDHNLCTA